MKTKAYSIVMVLALLTLWLGLCNANAFYDPGTQRWLNRDPIGEWGGKNLYRFVYNDPITQIDFFGFWGTGDPSNPSKNTIVCNGKGGIRVQRGNKNAPNTPNALLECIDKHEQSHADDALKSNPDVCKNKADGTQVTMADSEQKASEVKASNAEIDCLKKALKGCSASDKPWIDNRINQIEKYRDSF